MLQTLRRMVFYMKELPKNLICGDWITSPPSKDISWRKQWRHAIFLEYGKDGEAKVYYPNGRHISTAFGYDEWRKCRRPKSIT